MIDSPVTTGPGVAPELGRLRHLYEISTLLLQFEGAVTARAVHEVIARALPVRGGLVLLPAAGPPQVTGWHEDATSAADAEAHALAAFAYMTGSGSRLEDAETPGRRFVLLPLVVERRPLGALQVELGSDLDETDLVFLSAVASQLAIAVARRAAVLARQEVADAGRTAAEASQAHAEARTQTAEQVRARFEHLVDNLDGAFLWEAEPGSARVTYVSGNTEHVLGLPRPRWLASPDPWAECVHPEDGDRPRGPAPRLRALLAGARHRAPRLRAGPVDRPRPRRAPGRPGVGREPPRRGQHVLLHAAARRRLTRVLTCRRAPPLQRVESDGRIVRANGSYPKFSTSLQRNTGGDTATPPC